MEKAPFDINDMGLNIGDIEDDDFCRGFGFNTNENEDGYFENEESNEILNEINDKAPEMPQEFYHNLDSFLTRAPPKLTESSGLKKKTKPKTNKESAPMFPTIVQQQRTSEHHNSPPIPPSDRQPVKTKNKSTKDKTSGNSGKKIATQIDQSLLSEAFEYTDRLLKEAVIEEAQQQHQIQQQQKAVSTGHTSHSGYAAAGHRGDVNEDRHHTQQASSQPSARHAKSAPDSVYGSSAKQQRSGSGSNKEGGNSVNAIRRLKSNKQTGGTSSTQKSSSSSNLNTGFNTATEGEGDSRRNAVDFDELVANFQTGATLQRLRKELEASQASMASSQSYLRNLSKDYFR